MTGTPDLNDPVAVLLAVMRSLAAAGVDAAVYGGLALAVYGEPRETKDADLAVVGVGGAEGGAALRSGGLDSALALDRAPFGGLLITRLTLFGAGGVNTADLVEPRSSRYAEAALVRALTGTLRGETVRVLAPEDFILFKALSTRERDLEDAVTVVESLRPRLDGALLATEGERLAAEIPDHDVRGRLARVLGQGGVPPQS